mgnify:FL=1
MDGLTANVNNDAALPWHIVGNRAHNQSHQGSKAQLKAFTDAMRVLKFRRAVATNARYRHQDVRVGLREPTKIAGAMPGLFASSDIPAFTLVALWGRGLAQIRNGKTQRNPCNLDLHCGVVLNCPKLNAALPSRPAYSASTPRGTTPKAASSSASSQFRRARHSPGAAQRVRAVDIASLAFNWKPAGGHTVVPVCSSGDDLHYGAFVNEGSTQQRNAMLMLAKRPVKDTKKQGLESLVAVVITCEDVAEGEELFFNLPSKSHTTSTVAGFDWQTVPTAATRCHWPVVGNASGPSSPNYPKRARLSRHRSTKKSSRKSSNATSPSRSLRRESAALLQRAPLSASQSKQQACEDAISTKLGWPICPGLGVHVLPRSSSPRSPGGSKRKSTSSGGGGSGFKNGFVGGIVTHVRKDCITVHLVEEGSRIRIPTNDGGLGKRIRRVTFFDAVTIAYAWRHGSVTRGY